MSYYIGLLKNPAHPFSTYVVGEFVSQTDTKVILRNVARIIEMPQPSGQMGLNFMTDNFFSVDSNSETDKENFIFGRLLDPESDRTSQNLIESFYSKMRANRSGIAIPSLDTSALSKKRILP